MTAYFAILTAIILAAILTGLRIGRRLQNRGGKLPPSFGITAVGLGLFWFLAGWMTRTYADTDRCGAGLAGWFAHSGKWLLLLTAASYGHGLTIGLKQIPQPGLRWILYFVAVTGIAVLVVCRTIPIYFLLDNGKRDAKGYLRQSDKYEFTCGAVALLNYLEQFRGATNLTEREVSRICHVTPEGSTTPAIVNAAHHFGLTNTTARVLTMGELEQQKLPAIVSISTLPGLRHATLLLRLDAQHAWFIDPAYGSWNVTRQRFKEIWYGKTVLLE